MQKQGQTKDFTGNRKFLRAVTLQISARRGILWTILAQFIQHLLWPCIEYKMICNIVGFYDPPSMTCIVTFYDMYICLLWHCIEYKWCVSLPSVIWCLWFVWMPPMTLYSFNVYVSVPVWFKFELIRSLEAIDVKSMTCYWNFYGCLLWPVWQCDFYA